jgi:UPF0042 nucleotide-binding protein
MSADAANDRNLVLVTGMSGAGKSTALKVLEDLGYEAVDNLPLSLLSSLIQARESEAANVPMALCVDSRTRGFDIAHFEQYLGPLLAEKRSPKVTLLFLDCNSEVLRRRFTETRRRHPMAHDRPVHDGIRRERELLDWIRERADLTIDSSELSIRDFGLIMRAHFEHRANRKLAIFLMSFAFRQGLPPEADLVFDVRFLANPHYVPDLRPQTGLDAAVASYVSADPAYKPFFENLVGLVRPLLPAFEREGKSYLTIAVGCTGGRHRSVMVAARLATALSGEERAVSLRHRDLEGSNGPRRAPSGAGYESVVSSEEEAVG